MTKQKKAIGVKNLHMLSITLGVLLSGCEVKSQGRSNFPNDAKYIASAPNDATSAAAPDKDATSAGAPVKDATSAAAPDKDATSAAAPVKDATSAAASVKEGTRPEITLTSPVRKVYRFSNVRTGDYLLTIDPTEVAGEWRYEGLKFGAPANSGIRIFRCLRDNQKHFLSTFVDCEGAGRNEGVLFFGEAAGTKQVWRCYSPSRDVHLTTIARQECDINGFAQVVPLTKVSGN